MPHLEPSFLQKFDLSLKLVLYERFKTFLHLERDDPEDISGNVDVGVIQAPKAVAQRWHAEKLGANSLDFINLWRTGIKFSWERQKTGVAQRGFFLADPNDQEVVHHVKAAPVDIDYDMWIWSLDLNAIYWCIESYAFWQHENPQFSITFGDIFTIRPEIHFGRMVDESTVSEEFEKGVLFCYRFPISVEGWVLQDLGGSGPLVEKISTTMYDANATGARFTVLGEPLDEPDLEAAIRISRTELYNISVYVSPDVITLHKDYTTDFTVGEFIMVTESGDNDGKYEVVSASAVGGQTLIQVDRDVVVSAGAPGYVYKMET